MIGHEAHKPPAPDGCVWRDEDAEVHFCVAITHKQGTCTDGSAYRRTTVQALLWDASAGQWVDVDDRGYESRMFFKDALVAAHDQIAELTELSRGGKR